MSLRSAAAAALVAFLAVAASPARAADPCSICLDLDALEERCEDHFGDGTPVCEEIGEVEEACPQGDEGDDPDAWECPDLCHEIDVLADTCASELGADHGLCGALADLRSEACEPDGGGGGDDDGEDDCDDEDGDGEDDCDEGDGDGEGDCDDEDGDGEDDCDDEDGDGEGDCGDGEGGCDCDCDCDDHGGCGGHGGEGHDEGCDDDGEGHGGHNEGDDEGGEGDDRDEDGDGDPDAAEGEATVVAPIGACQSAPASPSAVALGLLGAVALATRRASPR